MCMLSAFKTLAAGVVANSWLPVETVRGSSLVNRKESGLCSPFFQLSRTEPLAIKSHLPIV